MLDDRDVRRAGMTRLRGGLLARWDRLARSGLVTVLGMLLVLAVLVTLWMAHLQGRIHKLTTTQEIPEQAAPVTRPGGQDLVHLNRFEVAGSMSPEFIAATLAPGRGMLILQAALNLPGRGEVPILLGTAEAQLNTAGTNLQGAEFSVRVQSREGSHWGPPVETVARRPSTQQGTAILPGGSRVEARFSSDISLPDGSTNHTGIESTVSSTITSRGLELDFLAKNTGLAPRAVTMAWLARFLASQAGIQGMSLVPPPQASGSSTRPTEQPLGFRDFDQTFTALQHSYLSAGPELLLRNQPDGYTLRFTALTPSIRSVHIQAGAHDRSVLVAFSTAAGGNNDEARTVVAPGESLHWRLRIEAISTSISQTP